MQMHGARLVLGVRGAALECGVKEGPQWRSVHHSFTIDSIYTLFQQLVEADITGCPISKFPLCFCHFLGFWSTYRGFSDLYSTALEICYMIATRILKIDLEIAEIIEVKVGTCNTKIIFLTLCNSKMSISK